jgi:UDP-N-acetylmuramate dehydrogenase
MKLQYNVPLAQYTSLRAGGLAEALAVLDTDDELIEVVERLESPVWVLGYGTNVLISDEGLPGTVILNQIGEVRVEDDRIIADAGAVWDDLVQAAIANGLWGLEFTSGIPGGVGAAIAGSIAAYGHRVSDRLAEAQVLNTKSGIVETWRSEKFNFGYRRSDLQLPMNSHYVVIRATFQLSKQPTGDLEYESALRAATDLGLNPDTLENRRQIIMEARRRAGSLLLDTDSGPWTAGSFFKNPLVNESQIQTLLSHEEFSVGRDQLVRQNVIHGGSQSRVSAAHVLLAAGFERGQSWGDVRLHPQHILKIENIGGATAAEIYDVVQTIIQTVKQKLNIDLEPEVRFLGEF